MNLDVTKYTSKSLIPRYKKSERKIGSKISLAKPKIYEQIPFQQNFPKQDNIDVLFPRHTGALPRSLTTKEEEEVSQNTKRDLTSVTVTTIMNLALGKCVSKYDVESTLLYLSFVKDDYGETPRNIKMMLPLLERARLL